jgi:TPR repeat protein
MDSPCKLIDLNTPIIKLMKCLIVTVLFIFAAPVFADDCFTKLEAGDLDSALIACTNAAEQGHAPAQYNLGLMYDRGHGIPKDDKQAFYWYTKAAEQGDAGAQLNLGVKHDYGKGTLKDSILAYAWYNISASQGNEQATKNRDLIEKEMTPNQIAEAQKLSREYYAKYVK